MRRGRELTVQKEEVRYLKKLVEEQERTIRSLEEDLVQRNTVSFFFFSIFAFIRRG